MPRGWFCLAGSSCLRFIAGRGCAGFGRWRSGGTARLRRGRNPPRAAYIGLMRLAFLAVGRDFNAYVANYHDARGMHYLHDVNDWLGGYPYESIRPAAVDEMLNRLGFAPVRSKVQPYSTGLFDSGCDEYVYRNSADPSR